MTYIEHDIDLAGHPKLLRLAARMGRSLELPADFPIDAGAIAEGLLSRLWGWCMKYADDGDLGPFDHDEVALAVGWRSDPDVFFELLHKARFLEDDEDVVHDWEDYAGKLVRRRKANASRMKKVRDEARRAEHESGTQKTRSAHVPDTCKTRALHVQSEQTDRTGTDRNRPEPRAPAREGPVDNSSPVDNSPSGSEVRSSSNNGKNAVLPAVPVSLCGPVSKVIGTSRVDELLREGSDLNRSVSRFLARIDELAERQLAELSDEKRESAKETCRRVAFARIAGTHLSQVSDGGEGIRNLPAYLTKAAKTAVLGDLVGDDLVNELRRKPSRGKSEPRPIGEILEATTP